MPHSDHEHATQTTSERAALSGDVASQALNEALRVSFRLLKVAILLVAGLFLTSGIFTVKQHEQAFVLRFGRVVTYRDPETRQEKSIFGPGIHFAWPFLIDEVVRFPVQRDLDLLVESFWHAEQPRLPGQPAPEGIAPDAGGYNLTGDVNILHSRWIVTYSVADPVKFCANLADPAELAADKPTGSVRRLLTNLLEGAVIRTIARYPVDDAYRGRRAQLQNDVKRDLLAQLRTLDAGIDVNNVILEVISPPVQTKKAFDDVTMAKEQSGKVIESARGYYESAITQSKGDASRIHSESQAYRTKVEAETQADASYMDTLLKQYPNDPTMLSHFLRQRLIEVLYEVLDAAEEVYVIKGTGDDRQEVRLWLKREPGAVRDMMQRRAEQRKQQEQKAKGEK